MAELSTVLSQTPRAIRQFSLSFTPTPTRHCARTRFGLLTRITLLRSELYISIIIYLFHALRWARRQI